MAPAALHRRREPESVSRRFVHISSALLMWSLAPLAAGTTIDVYVVARVITLSMAAAAAATVACAAFVLLWYVMPIGVSLRTDRNERE
jgi:hypothetical protein